VIRFQEAINRYRKTFFIFFLVLVFFFRLMYGLFSVFWLEDELQVYLIGLKFYATGVLPHYGPDVVYTETQLPGALQGLLVGLPFFLFPIPEAPYIFLCLLSFSAICLLAVYIRRSIPEIPGWFTWSWLMLCPWTLNYSNHVVNPSYVLPAAIIFFIGFFEVVPKLRSGFLGYRPAMFLIGFSLFWIFQLHKSWVLLVPFTVTALWFAYRNSKATILYFLAGCLVTGSLLLPILLDWINGIGGQSGGSVITLNPKNIVTILTLLSRYLSFASFELPFFIRANQEIRLTFLSTYYLLSPFILATALIGIAQPLYLTAGFFIKNPSSVFRPVKWLAFLTFLLVWLSFFFSVKGPSSHTFYLVFPVVMIYSFYCWLPLFRKKWFNILMIIMLVAGLITHSAIAHRNLVTRSMYLDREKPAVAIKEKDYHILGERRAFGRNP
jgi:hypothetical protein